MIQTEKQTDTMVVKPSGKITAANANEFRDSLHELFEAGHVDLTIDLVDVDMIDSKGLAVFIVCHQALQTKGGSLTVVSDNEDLLGLFRVMRLDQHFTVREPT